MSDLTKTLAESLRRISRIGADDPVSFEEKAARLSVAVGLATEALAKFDAAQQAAGEQALPPLPVPERLLAAFKRGGFRVPDTLDEAIASAANIMIEDRGVIEHMEQKLAAQAAQPLPAPAEGDALTLLRELHECGAVTNWLRVSDGLKKRIEAVIAAKPEPQQPAQAVPLSDEIMESALCESQSLVLREGQLYRFRRVGDCKKCAAMSKASLDAYGPPRATQETPR